MQQLKNNKLDRATSGDQMRYFMMNLRMNPQRENVADFLLLYNIKLSTESKGAGRNTSSHHHNLNSPLTNFGSLVWTTTESFVTKTSNSSKIVSKIGINPIDVVRKVFRSVFYASLHHVWRKNRIYYERKTTEVGIRR